VDSAAIKETRRVSREILLVQVLISSFFAIGFLRAHGPFNLDQRISVGGIFRLPGRLERLRRSRWQWFSMVLLMLIVRLQFGLPLVVELTVVFQFLVFLALPVRAEERIGTARKWNSYGV
jgi:hypothetical protein